MKMILPSLLITLIGLTLIPTSLCAAASIGQTPLARFQHAIKSDTFTADGVLHTFNNLSVPEKLEHEHISLLVDALSRKGKSTNRDEINRLAYSFGSSAPLVRWLRNEDYDTEVILLQTLKQEYGRVADLSQSDKYSISFAAPLKQIRETSAWPLMWWQWSQEPGARIDPQQQLKLMHENVTQERNIPQLYELALRAVAQEAAHDIIVHLRPRDTTQYASFFNRIVHYFTSKSLSLTKIIEEVNETDIHTYVAHYRAGATDEPLPTNIQTSLYSGIAQQIAHDIYLRLRQENQLSPQDAYAQLSPFLREHFKGVSVQDLLDYALEDSFTFKYIESATDTLDNIFNVRDVRLTNIHINDLRHIDKIPSIRQVKRLFLNNNYINVIHPETFAHLTQLQELYLHDNPITDIPPSRFASLTKLRWLILPLSIDKANKQQIHTAVRAIAPKVRVWFKDI